MELLQNLFEGITTTLPNVTAKLLLTFGLFIFNPYRNVRKAHIILKRRKLNGGILLVATFFAFVFILGIPSVSRPYLSFTNGWKISIERLNDIDLKGKQFVYLFAVIFVLAVLTIIFTEILKWLYRDRIKGKIKTEFDDMFVIFVSFTVGWFLIFYLIQSALFDFLPKAGGFLEQKFSLDEKRWAFVRNLYYYYSSDPSEVVISTKGWHYFVIILVTPATVAILYFTLRFGRNLLTSWSMEPQRRRDIRFGTGGRILWSVKDGTLPFIIVAAILLSSAVVISSLADILFSTVPTETHRENCVVSEVRQPGAKGAMEKKMNINLFYYNDENKAQMISPLYFALYPANDARRKSEAIDKLELEEGDAGTEPRPNIFHDNVDLPKDRIEYVVRIDASELLWLSGKGIIVEGGERRYFRLQFPIEELIPVDESLKNIGNVSCTLLIPARGEVVRIGTDNNNLASWRVILKSESGTGDRFLTAINVRNVTGDTLSDSGVVSGSGGDKFGP